MPKSGSIDLIFEREDDGTFSKRATMLQNILEYAVTLNLTLAEVPFFPTLPKMYSFKETPLIHWLLDHNAELRERFKGKGYNQFSKVASVRNLVKGRISDLRKMALLMELGTTTAEKTREEIPLYAFTPSGVVLAYLVDNIRRQNIEHIETLYHLTLSVTTGETALQTFLHTFFKKSMERGLFPSLVENVVKKIRGNQIDFSEQSGDAMTLFLHLIATDSSGERFNPAMASLWLEALDALDKQAKELFLFGRKQHLETIERWSDTKRETEIVRQQNAISYSQIVIEIWCRECLKTSPVLVDIPDIVRNDSMSKRCPKCNNGNSLEIPLERLKAELFL